MAAFSTFLTLCSLVFAVLCPGITAMPMEKMVTNLPTGWSLSGPANSTSLLSLQLGLQLSNLDQLESKLMDVSRPTSSSYGKYLDRDSVDAFFAPSPQAGQAVLQWLGYNNITDATSDGHWISFTTDVATANALLSADYSKFVDGNGNTKIRTKQYHVPDDVAEHIDLVTPTTYLGSVRSSTIISKRAAPKRTVSRRSDNATQPVANTNCSAALTPSCVRALYNVGNYTPDAACGSRIGFGSFLNITANYADIATFQDVYGLPHTNISVESFNGGIDDQSGINSVEGNLDSQWIMAMAHPLPVVEYLGGGSDYAIPNLVQPLGENYIEPWAPYYQFLLSYENDQLPQVISNSYGEQEQIVPKKYAQRVCNMIGLLGLRGISVLESSGDSGLGAACQTNDGRNNTRFEANFPSSCPYITSVGGTEGYPAEVAWASSGAGYSDYFPSPYYQRQAVSDFYFGQVPNTTRAYQSAFLNASGRAYPDIAAHSLKPGNAIILNGVERHVGGTSAAVPMVAGMIAMLNDARIRAGMPVMGFLNPWLYTVGKDGFKDITEGSVIGCTGVNMQTGKVPPGGARTIPYASFNATKGWDIATGWGVPDFEKLLKLALRD